MEHLPKPINLRQPQSKENFLNIVRPRRRTKILTTILTVLISVFVVSGAVFAGTTIGQYISIGSGTPNLTLGDGDLYVTGTTEVDGDLAAKTGGTATFVVAASNASDRVKNQADYVADGTADDVEIQAAIDALPIPVTNAGGGGTVMLSEGTFFISSSIKLKKQVSLVGQGRFSSVIRVSSGADVTAIITEDDGLSTIYTNIGIRHLGIEGRKTENGTGHSIHLFNVRYGVLEDLHIQNSRQDGIRLDGDSSTAASIHLSQIVVNAPGEKGIHITGTAADNYLVNIEVSDPADDGIFLDAGGNLLSNVHVFGAGSSSFQDLAAGSGVKINSVNNTLQNSYLESNQRHGLYLLDTGAGRNVIVGNTMQSNGKEASFTGYGIVVENSDFNLIQANIITDSAGTNTQDGINETGTSDNNVITDNHLFDLQDSVAKIQKVAASTVVRNNIGHTTESSATSTIASAATSTTVTHGLSVTPAAGDCSFVGAEDPDNSVGSMWIDTYTSTQMNLNVENDPGASNFDVSWTCAVY
jgi:parallel beta-helix repeat protein